MILKTRKSGLGLATWKKSDLLHLSLFGFSLGRADFILVCCGSRKEGVKVAILVLTQESGKSVNSHLPHSTQNPAAIADKPAMSPNPRYISHQFE